MITKDRVNTSMLQSILDAMPSFVFVVDDDVRIQEYNAAAAGLLSGNRTKIIKQRAGNVLHCLHSKEVSEGCGHAQFCKNCIIRNSVTDAFQGMSIVRKRTNLEIIQDGNITEIYTLITASPFQCEGKNFVLLVVEDISEIAELQRIIPICSMCRKVRDDEESWLRVETYFKTHWGIDFTHSLCPECMEKKYPEEYREMHPKKRKKNRTNS